MWKWYRAVSRRTSFKSYTKHETTIFGSMDNSHTCRWENRCLSQLALMGSWRFDPCATFRRGNWICTEHNLASSSCWDASIHICLFSKKVEILLHKDDVLGLSQDTWLISCYIYSFLKTKDSPSELHVIFLCRKDSGFLKSCSGLSRQFFFPNSII